MAACRGLPFLLALVCLVLVRGLSPLPTSSRVVRSPQGFSTKEPFSTSEDYGEEYPVSTQLPDVAPPTGGPRKRCDYNPCLENQVPCEKLAAAYRCLCPGATLPNEAPLAPRLESVSWNGSEVVIKWCAPYSHVTAYVATVGEVERKRFGKARRTGGLGNIEHISKVCVAAVNDAGVSKASCQMYQVPDSSLPLKAGLIGGALGLLLLLLLVVLLWRHKRQRKQQAGISMHNTAGTQ